MNPITVSSKTADPFKQKPLRPLPLDEPDLSGNETKYLKEAIASGWLSWQGSFVKKFEALFSQYIGCRYAFSCPNGPSALQLALLALEIGSGDEVIVPTLTFSATAAVVSVLGAKVVFADSAPGKFNVDPHEVEKKITSRTRALIVVHLYGWPADMEPILAIATKKGLPVIEDCAQAIGTSYKERTVGSIGAIGCFSFHNKQIATGEGGMVTTNDAAMAKRIETIRNPSPNNRTPSSHLALNFRMSNLHAAVGVAQLERVEELIRTRREHAVLYDRLLKGLKQIQLFEEKPWEYCTYWRYNMIVETSQENVVQKLNEARIGARPIYMPLHRHPSYRKQRNGRFVNADTLSQKAVDLPSSPKLSEKEIEYVAHQVRKALS